MISKYNLLPTLYSQLASWNFGDFIFGSAFDNITSTIKARHAGFHDCIDPEDMFAELFDSFRRRRVISPL